MKYILLIAVVWIASCQNESRLEQALKLAGDNRAELEKVLAHYSTEQSDRQNYASRMAGRKIQTACRSDFSDTVDIHRIEQIPYYMQEAKVADAPASRYVLYRFAEGVTESVAERSFGD